MEKDTTDTVTDKRIKIKVIKTILGCSLFLIALQSVAQTKDDRSTTGPVPPKGVDVVGHVSKTKALIVQQLITGVPVYIWKDGCGPTVVGMMSGYYDTHGFPDLLPGDASTQTPEVNTAIASTEHYNDYAIPIETALPVIPDKSELPPGNQHVDNCIADYMKTSRSVIGNIYGWSFGKDIKPSWENYIANYASNYVGTCNEYYYNSSTWDTLVSNVDRNHPMLLLVDTEGDGLTDHFVIVNGYQIDNGINYYGCFNTWDSNQHWYAFAQMASGVTWGVARCYTFQIHHKLPVAAGAITGPSIVCTGLTPIEYSVPLIDDATSYVWTLPSGASGNSSTNTISVVFNAGAVTGDISVMGHNSNGDGTPSSMNITVNIPPSAPTVSSIVQPTCSVSTGTVTLSGLPTGNWTITRNPEGASYPGAGSGATIQGLAAGTYSFTVTNAAGCTSTSSADVIINVQPATPPAPGVGTVTQPTCSVATGSVVLTGLPSSGTWTLTSISDGKTVTGTGSGKTISGLAAGTYNYTVSNSSGCTSSSSADIVINTQPATPAAPGVGTVTQPTCSVATGSVVLTGLPSSGTWTLTSLSDGKTVTGTGSGKTISGIVAGTYNYTVTNSSGCTSSASADIIINQQPVTPPTPVITLTVNTLHSSSPDGNNWYDQNGVINNAVNQDYPVTANGDYYVKVTRNGCTSGPSNTIKVIVTGLEQPAGSGIKVKVYPNPFTNEVTIERTGNDDIVTDYEILNSLGNVIIRGKLAEKSVINGSGFTRGVYILKVRMGVSFEYIKIIKQ